MYLGRRALQLHQYPHRSRALSVGEPAFRQIGARALHAGRFHRARRRLWHRVARKDRSEEHTSELQSLMRISYAVFCLTNKKETTVAQRQNELTTIYYPSAY